MRRSLHTLKVHKPMAFYLYLAGMYVHQAHQVPKHIHIPKEMLCPFPGLTLASDNH